MAEDPMEMEVKTDKAEAVSDDRPRSRRRSRSRSRSPSEARKASPSRQDAARDRMISAALPDRYGRDRRPTSDAATAGGGTDKGDRDRDRADRDRGGDRRGYQGRGRGRGDRGRNFRGGGRNFDRGGAPLIDPREEWRRQLRQTFTLVGDFNQRNDSSAPLSQNVISILAVLAHQKLLSGGDGTTDLTDMMVEAAASLGVQTPVYALMTAMSATKGVNKRARGGEEELPFGERVVRAVCSALAAALASGAFLEARLQVRFLGELTNCKLISAADMGELLLTLASGYLASPDSEVAQPCKDMVAMVVMSALPWCGTTLKGASNKGMEDIMVLLRNHMSKRANPFSKLGLRAVFHSTEEEEDSDAEGDVQKYSSPEEECTTDSLASMWAVVSAMDEAGWDISAEAAVIPRPWRDEEVSEQLAGVESIPLPLDCVGPDAIPAIIRLMGPLAAATCVELAAEAAKKISGSTPSPAQTLAYSYSLGVLCEYDLFHDESGGGAALAATLPPKEKVIMRAFIVDILTSFQPLISSDGTRVGNWNSISAQLLSIGKLLAPVIDGGAGATAAPYLVMELLMQAVVSLPQSPHMTAYLHRTILELCRKAPVDVAPAISLATGSIYNELPRMDYHSARQLSCWFSHHLKDTEYKWPFWQHWANVVDEPPDSPQRVFVTDSLELLVRLSYLERVRQAVPEALWPLLPVEPTIVNLYEREETDMEEEEGGGGGGDGTYVAVSLLARALIQKMQNGEEEGTILDWLDAQAQSLESEENFASSDHRHWRPAAIAHAIAVTGQLTPTHLNQSASQFGNLLSAAVQVGGDGAGRAAVSAILATWRYSPMNRLNTLHQLLLVGALPSIAVVDRFLSAASTAVAGRDPEPDDQGLWEVLVMALDLQMVFVSDAAIALAGARKARRKSKRGGILDNSMEVEEAVTDRAVEEEAVLAEALGTSAADARAMAERVVGGFVELLISGVDRLDKLGVSDPYSDPKWASVAAHFKATLRLLLAAKPLPEDMERTAAGPVLGPTLFAVPEGCSVYVRQLLEEAKAAQPLPIEDDNE